MKKISFLTLMLTAMLFSASCGKKAPAPEREAKKAGISIENQWVREVPPTQKMSAAYMTLVNNYDEDKVLVTTKNDASNITELHKMVMDGDVMKMDKIDSIIVPAHSSFELKPGGLHIMLIDLTKELKSGDTVNFELEFESGEKVSATAEVKKPKSQAY